MSVLVLIEATEGSIKKSSIEAACYAKAVATQTNAPVSALVVGDASETQIQTLGKFGIEKAYFLEGESFKSFAIGPVSVALTKAAKSTSANVIIGAKSNLSDAVLPRTTAALQASMTTNVVSLPSTSSGFEVKRSIFTGKAFATVKLEANIKVLSVKKNAIDLTESPVSIQVEKLEVSLSDADNSVKVTGQEKANAEISLPEADIVVSGGRGLKGPENWGLVTDLAKTLHAATGCSKPVSDLDWRPHHEHVGQTGIKVSPNLYIAIGISGAIQHIAGINSSKVIVAINKDPEAPIFKVADYGIVGDAFEVVPKLTEALSKI
jgi:electron transfer flavoprotein alpha subunit